MFKSKKKSLSLKFFTNAKLQKISINKPPHRFLIQKVRLLDIEKAQ
jgi:hypothetical protein